MTTSTDRAALAAEAKWTSVEDGMPQKFIEVLIAFRDSSLPATGQYTASPHDHDGWCFPIENDPDEVGPITHWRPLPNHPEEARFAQPSAQPVPATLPDPMKCRECTHPDCGRFDGPRSVECSALPFGACPQWPPEPRTTQATPAPEAAQATAGPPEVWIQLYQCARCGEWDYGEVGGPGHSDCVQFCKREHLT